MLTIKNPKTYDWANMPLSDCLEGNAADTYFTLKLFNLIEEKLEDIKLTNLHNNLVSPALEMFSEMEFNGLQVSRGMLDVVSRQLNQTNIEEEDKLYEFDEVLSTDKLSGDDLLAILYTREEGFALYPPDRTPTGKPSASAPTFQLLLDHIEEELQSRE